MIEEAQAHTQQDNLPIRDTVLVATANWAMVATNNYPEKTKGWNKLAPSERTWAKWKPTYKEAYIASQCSVVVQVEKRTPFGGLAKNPGSVKETQKPGGFKQDGTPKNDMMDSLSSYLDNMAAAAMRCPR